MAHLKEMRLARNRSEYPTEETRISEDDAAAALRTATEVVRGITAIVNAGTLPLFPR